VFGNCFQDYPPHPLPRNYDEADEPGVPQILLLDLLVDRTGNCFLPVPRNPLLAGGGR